MKSKRRLVHVLPLAAIVGASAIAIAGNVIVNDVKKISAADGISMTITGDLNFEITPEVGGTYAEKTINVTVDTANANGYTLYMASKDATSGGDVKAGIASVPETVAKADMPINSWGYYIGGDAVSPIPLSGSPAAIKVTDAPSNDSNKTTTVGIGVKVAPSLRSGNYGNVLSFSAVPNTPCEGIYCITTMQEMTPAVCAATTTPLATASEVTYTQTSDNTKIPRTILRDARDNKLYLVSKLADGKCWMSQNLALDLDSSVALTSATTDLNSVASWTPENSTSENINGLNQLYDYALYEPVGLYDARSYRPTGDLKYYRGGTTKSETPSTNDGKSNWESAGNYYNWFAATAGSGRKSMEYYDTYYSYEYQIASDSICPKGWRLPQTGEYMAAIDDAREMAYTYPYDTTWVGELFGFVNARKIYAGTTDVNDPSDPGSNHDSEFISYDSSALHTASVNDFYYRDIRDLGVDESFTYTYTYSAFDGVPVRCIAR